MNTSDLSLAILSLVDIVIENHGDPLELGDIRFEMLKTGKVKASHAPRTWTTADLINIICDLRSHLEKYVFKLDKQ